MPAVVKRCACGAAFTRRAWDRLPSIGAMTDGKYSIDCKNCPECGSTMAMPIGRVTEEANEVQHQHHQRAARPRPSARKTEVGKDR